MKAATPKPRAAVVQAQGPSDAAVTQQMLGELGTGYPGTYPQKHSLAATLIFLAERALRHSALLLWTFYSKLLLLLDK